MKESQQENQLLSQYNQQERESLANMVMRVLNEWNIRDEFQLQLLGLPTNTPQRELTKFSRGKALPDDDDLLARAVHLIGINQALSIIFPLNPKMPGFWLTMRNRHFRSQPLTIMLEEGLAGMDRIWCHLDCTHNW